MDAFRINEAVSASIQLRTLRALLGRVEQAAAGGAKPVVEIDLDLCALRPVHRTREALRAAGRQFGIQEFARPERLPLLPGYSDEAWLAFLDAMELEAKYPALAWRDDHGRPARAPGTVFGRFHDLYWTTAWMAEDSPSAGLGAFHHRIAELGGQVVFISGRWLPEHEAPTVACLRRAGIPSPALIIGNPWHETLRAAGGEVLTDAQIKVRHQQDVRSRYGEPVAVVDDRVANRDALVEEAGGTLLSLAIAIPGFSFDPASIETGWRISTFETFDYSVGCPPVRPLMSALHPQAGLGVPWRGLYEGLGKNDLPYVLPRFVDAPGEPINIRSCPRPFAALVEGEVETLDDRSFMRRCVETIPAPEVTRLRTALEQAERLAEAGAAASYPQTPGERETLWLNLVAAWLHARDIETLMGALGFLIHAAGVHDLEEYAPAAEVRAYLADRQRRGEVYGPWLLRWLDTLPPGNEPVNVGFLNPALTVSLLRWTPGAQQQEAMDVHRVSSHHDGDGAERQDPLESAVNNLLHQREGVYGLRKEPVEPWDRLEHQVALELGAEALANNSLGRLPLRDAVAIAATLERVGSLTPWWMVEAAPG